MQVGGCPPVAHYGAQFAYDEAGRFGSVGFLVSGYDSIVADLGSRHSDDLSIVRWVGEDFLIPRHAGVEYGFAHYGCFAPKGNSSEYAAIFQGKDCFLCFFHLVVALFDSLSL